MFTLFENMVRNILVLVRKTDSSALEQDMKFEQRGNNKGSGIMPLSIIKECFLIVLDASVFMSLEYGRRENFMSCSLCSLWPALFLLLKKSILNFMK